MKADVAGVPAVWIAVDDMDTLAVRSPARAAAAAASRGTHGILAACDEYKCRAYEKGESNQNGSHRFP